MPLAAARGPGRGGAMRTIRSRRGLAFLVALVSVATYAGQVGASPLAFFTETAPASAAYSGTGVIPLVGDFSGDGIDDIFFYRPGSGSESLYLGGSGRVFTHGT